MNKKFIQATNKLDDTKLIIAINHIECISEDNNGVCIHFISGNSVIIKEEYDLFENALLTMCGDYDDE